MLKTVEASLNALATNDYDYLRVSLVISSIFGLLSRFLFTQSRIKINSITILTVLLQGLKPILKTEDESLNALGSNG